MTIKNIGHSRKVRLLALSGHDNQEYQQMLVRYFHERFLYRLSRSRYREHFILKGGSLLFACDEFVPRPTLDIDFMGMRINRDAGTIKTAFIQVMNTEVQDDGIVFLPETISSDPITIEKEYPGLRLTFDGRLDSIRKTLTMDIGFGDVIIPNPVDMNYPTIFEEEDEIDILAYSLETVVAEKFQTIIERSILNSRMKDFFDLHRILSVHEFDEDTLQSAINATFENRNTEFTPSHLIFTEEFMNDGEMAQRWNNFLKKMKLESEMTFPEIVRFITTQLKPYWDKLSAKNG